MKNSEMLQALRNAKEQGYHFVASIVKQHMSTKYFHVVPIDEVLKKGKWIPCKSYCYLKWHGKIGTSHRHIDWTDTVQKSNLGMFLKGDIE